MATGLAVCSEGWSLYLVGWWWWWQFMLTRQMMMVPRLGSIYQNGTRSDKVERERGMVEAGTHRTTDHCVCVCLWL